MGRAKRMERVVALTKILVDHPQQLFSFSYFCKKFEVAKSTLSEDVVAVKNGLELFGLGKVETLAGAAGGVRFIPGHKVEDDNEFLKELDVTQLHVFSYSERPGTQALKIEHSVSPDEKHRRSQLLLALSDEKTRAFYASHMGQEAVVLMEKSKVGTPMHGFTENYVRVELPYDLSLDNQLIRVRMGDFNEEGTALSGAIL